MKHVNHVRRTLAIAALLALAAAAVANGQPTPAPVIRPATQLQEVKTMALPLQPRIEARLASKRALNTELLKRSLTYRNNLPFLTLKDGAQVPLLPLVEEAPPTAREREEAAVLTAKIAGYKGYINSWGLTIDPGIIQLLKKAVDHRKSQTPIRDQMDRGTCTAFAAMAGLEAFLNCNKLGNLNLSENHTYHIFMQKVSSTCKADPGIATYQGAAYLTGTKVCTEAQFPYTNMAGVPASDASHVPAICTKNAKYGFTSTQVILGTNFGGPAYLNANNPAYLESLLNTGHDIVYGLYVAGNDWSDGTAETGVVDVQTVNGKPASPYGGHAMLIVGYNHLMGYFIFKNSWNTTHGHAGYFYISYDYIQQYGKYGYFIKGVAH